mmetsp:Transcript_64/g.208  ORF Transcript_64/g.208 Transcript_64/m.208 type:complete len:85 (+) Transcript_64:46-300(+)
MQISSFMYRMNGNVRVHRTCALMHAHASLSQPTALPLHATNSVGGLSTAQQPAVCLADASINHSPLLKHLAGLRPMHKMNDHGN